MDRETHRAREPFKIAKETLRSHQAPEWLTIDAASLTATASSTRTTPVSRSSSDSSSSRLRSAIEMPPASGRTLPAPWRGAGSPRDGDVDASRHVA